MKTLVQVRVLLLAMGACAGFGCATLGSEKPDAADVYKQAMTACLACQLPNLPEDARKGCEKIRPVCDALAGICSEPEAEPDALVAPPPGYGRKVL